MAKHARVLTDAEFDALVGFVENKRNGTRNRLVVHLTHYAGMRIGEVTGLAHKDLIGRAFEELLKIHTLKHSFLRSAPDISPEQIKLLKNHN